MGGGSLFQAWLSLTIYLVPLGAIGGALIFGRSAERLGGIAIALAIAMTWAAQAVAGRAPVQAFLLIDLTLALSLAGIAVRYPEKLWPGLAGCAQFLVFVFSATRVIRYPLTETAYLVALTLSSVAVLGCLVVGTWRACWAKPRRDEWDEFAATLASRG